MDLGYIQMNVFAILMLLFLFWSLRKAKSDRFLADQKIFEWMLLANIAVLFFDALTAVFEGRRFAGALTLNRIVTAAYYSFNPLVGYFYIAYCECKLGLDSGKIRRRMRFYLIPLVVNAAISVASAFYPLYFSLGEDNRYRRGPVFALSFFLSYYLLLHAVLEVLYSAKRNKNVRPIKMYRSLFMFPVLPVVGGLLQIWLPGVSVVWVCTALSMLIIFINLQNTQIMVDPLTGAYNRGQIGPYIEHRLKKTGGKLFLIMLDVDGFKMINDRYGHLAGDNALVQTVKCLTASVMADDFLARYGGDEFVVVAERSGEDEIAALLRTIDRHAAQTTSAEWAYTLSFSKGYACWSDEIGTIDSFIAQADRQMYREKNEKTARTGGGRASS